MSLNPRQLEIYRAILANIPVDAEAEKSIQVHQTPGAVASVLEVADFATAVFAAMGVLASQLGQFRGLPAQSVTIDRRQAGMMFNSVAYFFRCGWQADISAVHTPVNNFYQTKDSRWVFFNGAYPHLRLGVLRFLNCPEEPGAIARAVAQWNGQELEDELSAQGFCVGMLRTAEEWLAHPNGCALAGEPLIAFDQNAGTGRPIPPAVARPLEGIRVLDFTHVVAGPSVGRLLAEQGADVVHVQNPYHDSIMSFDLETSFGKRSVYLDLDDPRDMAKIHELAAQADVVVDGYRHGALAARGLVAEELWKRNPGLVTVELNCYGFTGPWANRRGWEQLAQSVCGLAHRHSLGRPRPALVPAYFNDYGTGCLGAVGVMAALTRKFADHRGARVRVSLARTGMLGLEFSQNAEAAVPVGDGDLERYLVDQDSPHGLLTRVGPIAQLSHTPPYSRLAASFPGTSTLGFEWESAVEPGLKITHVPTRIFRDKVAHWRGHQEL